MIKNKKNRNEILKNLCNIFETNVKETDSINKIQNFDSIIFLQIMNLAKTNYKKNIDGQKISKCKKVSDIINLII
tara:strand:+ start:119 stop:343 length:225 start_codon:yes stop_codon:yes gene_type:complete